MIICNNCGAKNDNGAIFCHACKKELAQNQIGDNKYFEEQLKNDNLFGFLKSLKTLSIFLIVCGIVLLVGSIILTTVL